MLSVLGEVLFNAVFRFAFFSNIRNPGITVLSNFREIGRVWESPQEFAKRIMLLVPPGAALSARKVALNDCGQSHFLTPDFAERCVILQEGGMFDQGPALDLVGYR